MFESEKVKNFPFPLFLDHKKEYEKKNKFMGESLHFRTVLTDTENKILLLGNPIHSKEIKELYFKELHKHALKEPKVKVKIKISY